MPGPGRRCRDVPTQRTQLLVRHRGDLGARRSRSCPGVGFSSRMAQRPIVDLPEPDSPTRPRISPVRCAATRRRPRGTSPAGRVPGYSSTRFSTSSVGRCVDVGFSPRARCRVCRRRPRPSGSAAPLGRWPSTGTAASRRWVYSCCGLVNSSCTGACSTISPCVHHHHAVGQVGDHAHVVGDEHDRRCRGLRAGRAAAPGSRACTVTSSAVVGSSAMMSFGSQAMRHGDHHALPLTAGELVRVRVEPPLRLGDADLRQQLHGPRAGGLGADSRLWQQDRLVTCQPMV